MTGIALNDVMARWIDSKIWPPNAPPSQTILVLNATNPDGTTFRFQSVFIFFLVLATYHHDSDSLTDLEIELVVPLRTKSTTLIKKCSYALSMDDGEKIVIDIAGGYIKAIFAFKYGHLNGKRNIFATYSVTLPFTGILEDTVSIAPTTLGEGELNGIPALAVSQVSAPGMDVDRIIDKQTEKEQALLVKFLQDFVVEHDKIVLVTYYAAPTFHLDDDITVPTHYQIWDGAINFLRFLELSGDVDPHGLVISAALTVFVGVPEKIQLANISGSLLSGVEAKVDTFIAKGRARFIALENPIRGGKHDLFAEVDLDVKIIGKIKTDGKYRFYTLPF